MSDRNPPSGTIAAAGRRCYGDNVDRAARLRRLLVILSMTTAQPGVRAGDLAATLEVSTRTVFRDLARLQRLGFPVAFGNGYPAQQELFLRRKRQELSQVIADLVDQQLEVVRRTLPDEAKGVLDEASRYLPLEAAEAVTRAVVRAAGERKARGRARATMSRTVG
jgi:predicted DNA-binding transcriptional regulator YafY